MEAGVILVRRDDPWRPLLAAAALLAYWPVWRWFAVDMTDRPDDPGGIVALLAALFYFIARRSPEKRMLAAAALTLTLVYAATYRSTPHPIQLALALATVACLLGRKPGGCPNLGGLGLLAMALPIMPALQFYAGYPLRVVAGRLALPLLHLAGFGAQLRGANLVWGDRVIAIDAPCSGVQMLWTAGFLCCALSAFLELRPAATLRLAVVALAAVIVGNALRMAALFYAEAGMGGHLPMGGHEAAGLSVFAMVCAVVIWRAFANASPRDAQPCPC